MKNDRAPDVLNRDKYVPTPFKLPELISFWISFRFIFVTLSRHLLILYIFCVYHIIRITSQGMDYVYTDSI